MTYQDGLSRLGEAIMHNLSSNGDGLSFSTLGGQRRDTSKKAWKTIHYK